MQARTQGVLLAIVSAFGFSTLAIFGRLATLAGMGLPSLLAFRFLLATPIVWGILVATGQARPLSGRDLVIGLGLGGLGYATMSYLFLFGVNLTGAGLGAIILYIYPAIVVVMATVLLDERITMLTVASVVLAVVGVALVATGQPTRIDPLGIAILLFAAVAYATYITISRSILDRIEAPVLTAHVIPAAAVTFLVVSTVTGSFALPTGTEQWGVVIGIAILATVLPILTFFYAVSMIGASRASIVSTFEPVFTVVLGVALLGETLTATSIVGGVAVLTGVLLVQWERAAERS